MPVMDGIEAATRIKALDASATVIALTANIMASELERYMTSGMLDCLGKPFTSQELWHILLKYLTPVEGGQADGDGGGFGENAASLENLRRIFVKSNQAKYEEITAALEAGDMPLAQRLVHNLKGNAGIICKPRLQKAAAAVEAWLKNDAAGGAVTGGAVGVGTVAPDRPSAVKLPEGKANRLKAELHAVIEELKPLLDKPEPQNTVPALDPEQTRSLLGKLKTMLESGNTECLSFLPQVRAIEGGAKLAEQMENFDFNLAAQTLAELETEIKKKWSKLHG